MLFCDHGWSSTTELHQSERCFPWEPNAQTVLVSNSLALVLHYSLGIMEQRPVFAFSNFSTFWKNMVYVGNQWSGNKLFVMSQKGTYASLIPLTGEVVQRGVTFAWKQKVKIWEVGWEGRMSSSTSERLNVVLHSTKDTVFTSSSASIMHCLHGCCSQQKGWGRWRFAILKQCGLD